MVELTGIIFALSMKMLVGVILTQPLKANNRENSLTKLAQV